MLNKKGNRLIKPILHLYNIAVSFLGSCVSPLYLVSQGLQEINSFIVAFDLLCFKRVTELYTSLVKYSVHLILLFLQQSLKRRGSKDLPKSEKKSQQTPTEVCCNNSSPDSHVKASGNDGHDL